MSDEPSPREQPTGEDCRVGDWVRSTAVPDWPVGERLHMLPFPHPLSPPVPTAAPVHPALAALFEQS